MDEKEKKAFLKRMGFLGSTSAEPRVEPGVVPYKKPYEKKPTLSRYVDKAELLELHHLFNDNHQKEQ